MIVRHRASFLTATALAVGSLLTACSNGGDQAAQTAVSPARPATTSQPTPAPKPVAYNPGPEGAPFTQCNIESFDQVRFQASPIQADLSTRHNVAGWVADPDMAHPGYWLRLEDKAQGRYFQVELTPSISRPDVAAHEGGGSNSLASGFVQKLPDQAVPPGHYHVYVAAVSGGNTSLCDNGRYVDFR